MIKNNFKLKLKIKNSSNLNTPIPNNQAHFFNINSCPIQNNKLNFNYIFWKENKNNQNKMPIQFNNNLMNDNSKNEMNIQQNLNQEFIKAGNPSNINENNIKKEKQKIHPIQQNLFKKFENTKNYPKIKKRVNSNLTPLKEENNHGNFPKSNNLLPYVVKDNKKILNKSKPKNLFHNKSGGNIKINIDCAVKKKINDIEQKDAKNINIIKINKNELDVHDIVNYSENNLIKIKNMPFKKQKKLIEYFYKEEPNLNHNKSMEDFIFIKTPFMDIKKHNLSLFALFDGHGGKDVAEYLKNNICDVLTKTINESEDFNLENIIKNAIGKIDKDLQKLKNVKECGSTGTIVLIDNDIVYCVNVGDSKCYIINDKEAIQMTEDHNCRNKLEVETIKKKGAIVFNGRVFGCLCLTRTFGDTDFKEFGIDCEPYIKKISINKDNIKYIVIASDGIWDIVDDKQLFKIQNELKTGNSEEFCNNLVEYSLNGGSNDNISCIVLKFGEENSIK